MEHPLQYALWIAFLACVAAFLFLRGRQRRGVPPGPWGLPLLGYSPFLGKEPHLGLQKLSKKYGDVFGLYLGTTYYVVVTDYATAKDLFKQLSTSDRPTDLFQFMPGGVGLGNLNGPHWMEQRRYTVQKMKNLGFGRSTWEKFVQIEARDFINLIGNHEGRPVDIVGPLSASISNNVLTLLTGHRLPVGDPKRDIVDSGVTAFVKLYDQSGLIALFPKVFKIAVALGFIKARDKLEAMAEMNRYVSDNIHNPMQTEETSYVQEYLKEIEKNKETNGTNSFNAHNLVGNVQALMIAGNDTTWLGIYWLFLAMASFPDIQDKVQHEIDTVLGSDELTSWEERRRMPYCHAAILEGQRWRTVAPLNVLHRSSQDTPIRDFIIPKGSNIIAMIWAFHMDPKNWKDPEEFRPERFLEEDGSLTKKIDNYAPFSLGKRQCIGETVANIELFLYFVGVMQRFRIKPPSEGASPDLKGTLGLTLRPARQTLRFVPRSADVRRPAVP